MQSDRTKYHKSTCLRHYNILHNPCYTCAFTLYAPNNPITNIQHSEPSVMVVGLPFVTLLVPMPLPQSAPAPLTLDWRVWDPAPMSST